MSKELRGGAREGAGRKKVAHSEKKVAIAMRVKPVYKAWLQEQAELQGESIGRIIEVLIDNFNDIEDGE